MENKPKTNYLTTVVVALVIGALAFMAGIKYQQSKLPAFRQMANRNGVRLGVNQTGVRPINGTIISLDDQGLTVELPDGSSRIVLLSTNTKINKASPVNLSDLTLGESVSLFGTENSDGSLTAQIISVGQDFMSRQNIPTKPTEE